MLKRHLTIVSAAAALVTFASTVASSASARLPWAATSGLHFVEAIVNADNYRAAAGGLAIKRSPSSAVREFGRTLWVDSIERKRRLKWTLTEHDRLVVLPERVSPRYMFVLDELVLADGDAFDQRFIAQQTASLTQTLALTQAYARFGDDFDLKEYATRSVPVLQSQLERVRGLAMQQRGRLGGDQRLSSNISSSVRWSDEKLLSEIR